LDEGPDGEGVISLTEVVDEDSEAGKLACGEVRTRLDRRRPGMVPLYLYQLYRYLTVVMMVVVVMGTMVTEITKVYI
jgi:hypothetical protein